MGPTLSVRNPRMRAFYAKTCGRMQVIFTVPMFNHHLAETCRREGGAPPRHPTTEWANAQGGATLLLPLLFVVCLGAGCSSPPSGDPVKPPPLLVTPEEQERLVSTLLAELRENREKRCPRPALRGPGLPGRPDPLLVALVEPEGDLARCAQAVERTEPRWRAALLASAQGQGALPRLGPGPPTPGFATEVESLATACATLPEALHRAVRFEAACSPYLPGRRRLPHLGPLVRILEGAALLAHRRSGEDPEGAAFLLLESLRVQQDLCRGGVPWIWPFVLRQPLRLTVSVLGHLLAAGRLGPGALASLGAALEALGRSEPTPESYLQGERLTVELGSYLIPVMPPGWVPPGGEPTPGFNPGAGVSHRALGSPRQDLLLSWLAHRQRSGRWASACSPKERPARCLEALEAFNQEMRDRVGHLSERWKALEGRLGRALTEESGRARRAVLEWLVALGPMSTADHLRRAAERPFWLAALRLHLAVLRAQAGASEPLTTGQVLALPPAREDPFWGEALSGQGVPGNVELRPPRALAPASDPPLGYPLAWPVPRDLRRDPPGRRGSP